MLKLVNSSASGLVHSIESVRHAVVLLGIEHVRQLATLLALAATARTNTELITLAVTRAQLATHLLADTGETNSAYTAGLLSVIDALDEIREAFGRSTRTAAVLSRQAVMLATG